MRSYSIYSAGFGLCCVLNSPVLLAADAAAGASLPVSDVVVTAQRLDAARNGLSPETGSDIYRFTTDDIEALPLGEATPLNQLILRSPGVVQDSYGQLHVRGDHANLQYRINGVVIPESISGFGQSLGTRFADRINILTGALPAQYGYRTAGVVDIHTKGYIPESAGSIELTAGSYDHREVGADFSGSSGPFSYFLTGNYLRNDLGIEDPTADRHALHDETRQARGFGYLSYILSDTSRVSFMYGISDNRFQIPDVPGQEPSFALAGAPVVDSSTLDANQREKNRFEVLTYQSTLSDAIDYQASVFHRYTDVTYRPDPIGDLVFNGVAAQILRSNEEIGAQFDSSFKLNDQHTIRAGLSYTHERFDAGNSSTVFDANEDGTQSTDIPRTIVDNTRLSGHTIGVHLQDEWQPVTGLTVNYGARFDQVDTVVKEHQFSPRLGVVYDVTPATRVHAGYARYFTPPPTEKIDTTSVQAFLGTTNALPSDANTAVSSERSHYFDMGMSHDVTSSLTVGLDGYYRKVKNLQDEGQFGNALIFSAFNYDRAKIFGVELTSNYHSEKFSAYLNVAWSEAKARDVVTGQFNFAPDELNYIANNWVYVDHDQRWSSSAGMSYKLQDTTLSADAIYGSGLRNGFANTGELPAYTEANLAVAQDFNVGSLGKLTARFAGINVFDHVYELRDGSGIGVGAPQFGQRRSVYVSLSKTF